MKAYYAISLLRSHNGRWKRWAGSSINTSAKSGSLVRSLVFFCKTSIVVLGAGLLAIALGVFRNGGEPESSRLKGISNSRSLR